VLGCTMEYIRLPSTLAARIEGKSSVGRMGLAIHVTAGFVDPGFYGQLTLELVNHSGRPVFLKPGMRIAQMSFHTLSQLPRRVYGDPALGSHYQGQVGPTPSYLEETGG
jgi:dCTP deaminase